MLSIQEAKIIGINACIDKIGRRLCEQYASNSTSAYGESNGKVSCFVGINDEPAPDFDITSVNELILSEPNDWKYSAECLVNLEDGKIEFI